MCSLCIFFKKILYGLVLHGIIIACIGFWGSQVFYNSFLPEIAAIEDRDRISAKGFVYGYIGSVLLQLICFVFVMMHDTFKITEDKGAQISFLLVGIWWWSFARFSLSRLPNPVPAGTGDQHNILTNGYQRIKQGLEPGKTFA